MSRQTVFRCRPESRRREKGVVLFIALIMLVALSLAGIALFRQVAAGSLIAGNLTFRTAAVAASDRGIEGGLNWLKGRSTGELEQPMSGYFPAWCNVSVNASNIPDANDDGVADNCGASPPPSTFDPTSFQWANAALVTSDDGNGNEVRYVIHRMCQTVGSVNGASQQCSTVAATNTGGSKTEALDVLSNTVQPYFRITARVLGPKNTVAYTQAIVY